MENNKERKKRLSFKESWEVIFWSFYYSRGSQELQDYLLEYFKRKYGFSILLSVLPVPKKIIDDTVKFREGPRHMQTRDSTNTTSHRGLIELSKQELTKQARIICGIETSRENLLLRKMDGFTLLSMLASELKKKDKDMTERGFRHKHVDEHFLSNEKMPGVKYFETLREDLKPFLNNKI